MELNLTSKEALSLLTIGLDHVNQPTSKVNNKEHLTTVYAFERDIIALQVLIEETTKELQAHEAKARETRSEVIKQMHAIKRARDAYLEVREHNETYEQQRPENYGKEINKSVDNLLNKVYNKDS